MPPLSPDFAFLLILRSRGLFDSVILAERSQISVLVSGFGSPSQPPDDKLFIAA
jgi:hypothetical protein